MKIIQKIEAVLKSLGLFEAIKGLPGLLIPIIISIALLKVIVSQISWPLSSLSESVLHLLVLLIGTLLGLIGYYAGNFWDSIAFDPRYGIYGKWLVKNKSPLHIFPAGSDLKRYRDQATQALFQNGHSGEGIYREAKKLAMEVPEKWESIEQPLVLSKFIRSFIWPFVLIVVVSCIGILGSLLLNWDFDLRFLTSIAILATFFSIFLFVPYFQLRVEHMIRLYEFARETRQSLKGG